MEERTLTKSLHLKASLLCMAVLIRVGAVSAQQGNPLPPPPTVHAPEPSTILSFVVAVVIGVGVFLLGRLRKVRK
jgi:hypothetical protein